MNSLSELGYVEGQNIVTEYRYTQGKVDRYPEVVAELVRLKVDIIVVAGGNTPDPSGQECDQNDSHRYDGRWNRSCRGRANWQPCPSRRQRGPALLLSFPGELGGRRLELLKEAVPNSCPRRGSLRCGHNPVRCKRGERGFSSRGACAEVDYSALGGTSCGR